MGKSRLSQILCDPLLKGEGAAHWSNLCLLHLVLKPPKWLQMTVLTDYANATALVAVGEGCSPWLHQMLGC